MNAPVALRFVVLVALASLTPPAAAEAGFLKEVSRAAGASSQTVIVSDPLGTSLLSLVNTGVSRSLVRVDAVSGLVQWQTDVVPGVGWGSFAVRGDDVIVQGVVLTGTSAQVAVVSLGSGERRWTRTLADDVRLEFGENGGMVLSGDCALTVLGEGGVDVEPLSGVQVQSGVDSLCAARPRLLGEVAGRSIVEVPGPGDTWRLDAVGRDGVGWTADLGVLSSPPEVDWRTGVFWARSSEGLVLRRYNLATGRVAWKSVRPVHGCAPVVRAVTGPLGAPSILLQACDSVTLIDPHDGTAMWEGSGADGDVILEGEAFGLPEWIQPTQSGRAVRWFDPNGKPAGHATVGPDCFGVPVTEGMLTRSPAAVALVGRDGREVWSLPIVSPRWALMGDLLVIAPELGDTRLIVRRATGEVLGRFSGGEAIGVAPVPGSTSQRLVFAQGSELRALKLVVRP